MIHNTIPAVLKLIIMTEFTSKTDAERPSNTPRRLSDLFLSPCATSGHDRAPSADVDAGTGDVGSRRRCQEHGSLRHVLPGALPPQGSPR